MRTKRAQLPLLALSFFLTSGYVMAQFGLNGVPSNQSAVSPVALTQDAGPWLIMATTFTGEGAAQKAFSLVKELREQHGMTAYVFHERIDNDPNDENTPADSRGYRIQYEYLNENNHRWNSYAVIVGDFTSVDDPRLEKALDKIKTMKPQTLNPHSFLMQQTEEKSAQIGFTEWRQYLDRLRVKAGDQDVAELGPMGRAHAMPNPLIDWEKRRHEQQVLASPFVVKLNKNSKYSLLECQAKHTLAVATFTGRSKFCEGDNDLQKYESGQEKFESRLEKAAYMAEKLCHALRAKNYEAYTYHDRHYSQVTIGGWDQYGTERPNGIIDLRSDVAWLMQTFQAKPRLDPLTGRTSFFPFRMKSLPDIPFDHQPKIVKVPRKSVVANYQSEEESSGGLQSIF